MKKITLLSILLVAFLGCGEEKEKADTITEISFIGSGYTYAFVKKRLIDREIFRVYKADTKWKIVSYEFNATHFKAKDLDKKSTDEQVGTYKVLEKGRLKLSSITEESYIKPIKEDDEKVYLVWSVNPSDMNKSEATPDMYFFAKLKFAEKFVR